MGSFKEYINRNNSTVTNTTSSSSSFVEYHNRRKKEREEEEERQRRLQKQKEKKAETKSNSLPKASEEKKNKQSLEELQENISMSPTEQTQQRKERNNPNNKLKQYASSAQIREEHLKNIQEGNIKKVDKFVPSIQYKSSPVTESISDFHKENSAPAVKNLFLGLGKGTMHFAESGVSAIDRTYQERDKMMDRMTANANEIRVEKGFEPLPTAEESKKIILGDSYNKDLFGRDKEEQQKKWEDKKSEIDTKIASNIEETDSFVGKKLAELAPSIGNQLPGYLLPSGAGLVYFTGSAKGAYVEDAKARGMSEEDANAYSGIMALGEGLTDMLGAKLAKGVGKNIVKGNAKDALKLFGLDIFENAVEEAIMEPISETTATLTGGKETANWDNIGKRMLNSGINGGLSAVIMSGTSAGVGKAVRLTNKINNREQVSTQEVSEAVKETLESDKVNQEELKKIIKENTNEIIKQEISEIQEHGMTQEQKEAQIKQASENFTKQVDSVKNGTFPKNDMLVLGNTPQALKDIGLPDLPITMTQKHLDTIMNETGKYKGANYHNLGEEIVKQLPEAINNPLDIVKSKTKDDSVVLTTYLADKENRTVIASIKIDGKGSVNDIRIDTNVMTSAYGRNNYDAFMEKNLKEDNILYDIDRGVIKKVTGERLQLPIRSNFSTSGRLQLPTSGNTINNSITPQNENVNYTNNYAQKSKNDTQINQNVAPSMENNVLPVAESIIQKGEKQRKHYKSIMQSQYTSNEARTISKKLMGTDTYVPESNNKQLERADERISIAGADSELNSLMSRAMTGGNIKADDIAVGERLIQYYSKIGNKEKLSEAIQATAMAGTTAGQTVQAMSLLNHQTPEGQAIWLQRSIEKMNNKLGDKADQFKLTPEMTEKIVNSKNNEELQNNLNEVYEELGQQVSKSSIQKIDAWRYFAMLANPKTHIRNIVGNTAMAGTQSVKNKVAGIIEGTVAKFNPGMERNHTVIPVSEEVKNYAKSDIVNVADRLGLNENKYNPKTRLENSMRTFKSDAMENTVGKVFDLNDKALEAEDGWGLKSAYTKALSEYMTSNKLKPDTITDAQLSKARNYAIEQAKEATFHQESNLATLLNQLSNKNKFTKFVMDATLPFKKTPINVAKAGLEYSPVGLVKSAVYDTAQLRKGNITINKYIDNISKGLTGTGIALVGYALASCGVLKASGSDDKDKEGFDKARGNQTYSIKIGDNTYSLDWLSPVGIPLFIGAECYEIGQEAKKENTSSSDEDSMYNKIVESATNVLDSFTNAMNPMTEMSMLSGLTSAIKSYDGDNSKMLANIGVNAGKSYINQFVPTALSQIARTTDKYERSTTSTKTGTLPKAIDSSKNYIMSKIPGVRQMLPKKTDVWGNEVKQSENILLRATENSLFPWTRKEISANNVDNAILKVYESTGENSVFPDSINKNITINSKKYIMTFGEYAKYQRQFGKTSYTLLNNLINSNSYRKMSNVQKQKAIENVYTYAQEQIKIDYAKQNKLEYEESALSKTINAIKKTGGNTGNYLEYTALTKDLKKDSEKIELLANANYSSNTKKAIYENSLGEDDTTYKIVKGSFTETGLNITKYLNYKNQEFLADRKDDGTIKGQPISGSKKTKVLNYIKNIPGATNTQKLLLYALQYEPNTNAEKQQVVNYINSLRGYTKEEKIELLSKLKGITIYKNGKYEY